jgi:hypothetical protein
VMHTNGGQSFKKVVYTKVIKGFNTQGVDGEHDMEIGDKWPWACVQSMKT